MRQQKILAVVTAAICIGGPLLGDESDAFVQIDFEALDQACLAVTEAKANELYDGFTGIKSSAPFSFHSENFGVVVTTYNNVTFESEYGDANAAVVCLFQAGDIEPADLQISFDAPGMAGYTRHPLQQLLPAEDRDLSNSFSMGHATTLKFLR